MLASQSTDTSITNDSAMCSFGEIVLADIKPIAVNKLAIRNNEQKIEGTWLGKTTNSDEHIIATEENHGKIFHTRSFENIDIPQMDSTMNADYKGGEDIGKAIIEQFVTKASLTQSQSGHHFWINNKEVQQPPDLDNTSAQQPEDHTIEQDTLQPPFSLEFPEHTYVHPS
eukprot:6491609-Amphidinium_carterae.2